MMVFSASGRTTVSVEVAAGARRRGLGVIAVLSRAQCAASPSAGRESLADHADVILDLCTPAGDAAVDLPGLAGPVGPTTTLAAAAVVNTLKVRTAELLLEQGVDFPVITTPGVAGLEGSRLSVEMALAEQGRRMRRAPRSGRRA